MGYSTSDFSFSFDLLIFFNLQKHVVCLLACAMQSCGYEEIILELPILGGKIWMLKSEKKHMNAVATHKMHPEK